MHAEQRATVEVQRLKCVSCQKSVIDQVVEFRLCYKYSTEKGRKNTKAACLSNSCISKLFKKNKVMVSLRLLFTRRGSVLSKLELSEGESSN